MLVLIVFAFQMPQTASFSQIVDFESVCRSLNDEDNEDKLRDFKEKVQKNLFEWLEAVAMLLEKKGETQENRESAMKSTATVSKTLQKNEIWFPQDESTRVGELVTRALKVCMDNAFSAEERVDYWLNLAFVCEGVLSIESNVVCQPFLNYAKKWFKEANKDVIRKLLPNAWPLFIDTYCKHRRNPSMLRIFCNPIVSPNINKFFTPEEIFSIWLKRASKMSGDDLSDQFSVICLPILRAFFGNAMAAKENITSAEASTAITDKSVMFYNPLGDRHTEYPVRPPTMRSQLIPFLSTVMGNNPDQSKEFSLTEAALCANSILLVQSIRLALVLSNGKEQEQKTLMQCMGNIVNVVMSKGSQKEQETLLSQMYGILEKDANGVDLDIFLCRGGSLTCIVESAPHSLSKRKVLLEILDIMSKNETKNEDAAILKAFDSILVEISKITHNAIVISETKKVMDTVMIWVKPAKFSDDIMREMIKKILDMYYKFLDTAEDINEGTGSPSFPTSISILSLPFVYYSQQDEIKDYDGLFSSLCFVYSKLSVYLSQEADTHTMTAAEEWMEKIMKGNTDKMGQLAIRAMCMKVICEKSNLACVRDPVEEGSFGNGMGELKNTAQILKRLMDECVRMWEKTKTSKVLSSSAVDLTDCIVSILSSKAKNIVKSSFLIFISSSINKLFACHSLLQKTLGDKLKEILLSMKSFWCLPNDQDNLDCLSSLLVLSMGHSDKVIKESAGKFWSKTFGKSCSLVVSSNLENELASLRKRMPHLAIAPVHSREESVEVISSQSADDLEEVALQMLPGSPKKKMNETKKEEITPKSEKKRGNKLSLSDDDSVSYFQVEDSPKRMRMTEKQKEKMAEQKDFRVPYFEEDSQCAQKAHMVELFDSQSVSCMDVSTSSQREKGPIEFKTQVDGQEEKKDVVSAMETTANEEDEVMKDEMNGSATSSSVSSPKKRCDLIRIDDSDESCRGSATRTTSSAKSRRSMAKTTPVKTVASTPKSEKRGRQSGIVEFFKKTPDGKTKKVHDEDDAPLIQLVNKKEKEEVTKKENEEEEVAVKKKRGRPSKAGLEVKEGETKKETPKSERRKRKSEVVTEEVKEKEKTEEEKEKDTVMEVEEKKEGKRRSRKTEEVKEKKKKDITMVKTPQSEKRRGRPRKSMVAPSVKKKEKDTVMEVEEKKDELEEMGIVASQDRACSPPLMSLESPVGERRPIPPSPPTPKKDNEEHASIACTPDAVALRYLEKGTPGILKTPLSASKRLRVHFNQENERGNDKEETEKEENENNECSPTQKSPVTRSSPAKLITSPKASPLVTDDDGAIFPSLVDSTEPITAVISKLLPFPSANPMLIKKQLQKEGITTVGQLAMKKRKELSSLNSIRRPIETVQYALESFKSKGESSAAKKIFGQVKTNDNPKHSPRPVGALARKRLAMSSPIKGQPSPKKALIEEDRATSPEMEEIIIMDTNTVLPMYTVEAEQRKDTVVVEEKEEEKKQIVEEENTKEVMEEESTEEIVKEEKKKETSAGQSLDTVKTVQEKDAVVIEEKEEERKEIVEEEEVQEIVEDEEVQEIMEEEEVQEIVDEEKKKEEVAREKDVELITVDDDEEEEKKEEATEEKKTVEETRSPSPNENEQPGIEGLIARAKQNLADIEVYLKANPQMDKTAVSEIHNMYRDGESTLFKAIYAKK